jgi:hypothetical protein
VYLCLDESLSSEIFKNQITTLILAINGNNENYEMIESIANIFNSIFVIFTRLTTLIVYESSYKNRIRLDFSDPLLPNFRSSTLLQLTINAECFDDCLCLLDGRFIHLHTLCVDLANIYSSHEIQNQVSCIKALCYQMMKEILFFSGRFAKSKTFFYLLQLRNM